MEIQDERTEEQKSTHIFGVVAKDKIASFWGNASGGPSRVAWACKCYDDASKIFDWLESRPEMANISIVDLRKYSPPPKEAQFYVHVAHPFHPALKLEQANN
jgi:hypothetical protein